MIIAEKNTRPVMNVATEKAKPLPSERFDLRGRGGPFPLRLQL